jgi:hypothetical protein
MLILWIRRKKEPRQNRQQEDERNSFLKHDDEMKKFRLAHPELENRTPGDIVTADGQILAAVQGFRLNNNIQN